MVGTDLEAADTTAGVSETGWKPRHDRGAKTSKAWRETYRATTLRQKEPQPLKRSWQEEVRQKVLSDPFGDGSGNGAKKIEQTKAREPQQTTQSPTGQVSNPIFRLITTEDRQEVHGTGATLESIDSQGTGAAPVENDVSFKKPIQGFSVIQLNRSPTPTPLADPSPDENDLEPTESTQDDAADLVVIQQIPSSAPEDPDEETELAAAEDDPQTAIQNQDLVEVQQSASLASNDSSDEAVVTAVEDEENTATPPHDFSILQLETTVVSTEPGDEVEEAPEKADFKNASNSSDSGILFTRAIAATTVEENTANDPELATYGDTILAQANHPPTATNAAVRPQETDYEKDCQLSREYLLDRKLSGITLNIAVHGKPGEDFPVSCDLETEPLPLNHYRLGEQELLNFTWTASGLCHKPLYFEEVQAERYGHTIGLLNQPFLSAAHFFCNAAVLPYKIGMRPPQECVYPLGRYRVGSYAPRYIPAMPISIRGGLLQAGGVLAAVFVLP